MKVRATKDGHYGGYYRTGPVDTDNGTVPGEVFEIETKPVPMLDPESKKPIPMTDEKGKVIFKTDAKGNKLKDDKGNPIPEIRMITHFSPEWMEKVPEDTEVTNDYPPYQPPIAYREKKKKNVELNKKGLSVGASLKAMDKEEKEESVI